MRTWVLSVSLVLASGGCLWGFDEGLLDAVYDSCVDRLFTIEYQPMQSGAAQAGIAGCFTPCTLETPVVLGSEITVEAKLPGEEARLDGAASSDPIIAEVAYERQEEADRECDPELVFDVAAQSEGETEVLVVSEGVEIDRFTISVRAAAAIGLSSEDVPLGAEDEVVVPASGQAMLTATIRDATGTPLQPGSNLELEVDPEGLATAETAPLFPSAPSGGAFGIRIRGQQEGDAVLHVRAPGVEASVGLHVEAPAVP